MISFLLAAILSIAPYNGGQWDQPYNAYHGRKLTIGQSFHGTNELDTICTGTKTYLYDEYGTQTGYVDIYTQPNGLYKDVVTETPKLKEYKTYIQDPATKEWVLNASKTSKYESYGLVEYEEFNYYFQTSKVAVVWEKTTTTFESDDPSRPLETITYKRDPITEELAPYSKISYTYDGYDCPFRATYYWQSNSASWRPSMASQKAKNAAGKPLLERNYQWDSSKQDWYLRDETGYEYENDTLEIVKWHFDTSVGYRYGYRLEYGYDAMGRRTKEARYTIDEHHTPETYGTMRTDTDYNDPRGLAEIDYNWENGVWTPYRKHIEKSDATIDYSQYERWDGSDWTLELRHEIRYQKIGDTTVVVYKEYRQPDPYQSLGDLHLYTYDEKARNTAASYYMWRNAIDDWRLENSFQDTYDSHDNLIGHNVIMSMNGDYYAGSKEIYEFDADDHMVYGEYYIGLGESDKDLFYDLDQYVKCSYDSRGNMVFSENKIREQEGTLGLRHWADGSQNYMTYDDRDSLIRLENMKYDIPSRSFKPYQIVELKYGEVLSGYRCTNQVISLYNADSVRWEPYGTYNVYVEGISEYEISEIPGHYHKLRYDRETVTGGLKETWYEYASGEWMPMYRKINTVINGRIGYEYDYFYTDFGYRLWVGAEKWEHEYDEYGHLTYEVMYEWDMSDEKWFENWKKEKTYTQDGYVLSEDSYLWNRDDKRWVGEESMKYDWDAARNQTLISWNSWDDVSRRWTLNARIESEFDEWGHRTSYATYHGGADDTWVGETMWRKGYDENGRMTLSEQYTWDAQAKAFVGSSLKQEFWYGDDDDNYIETRYEWVDGGWQANYRETHLKNYDEYHNCQEILWLSERLVNGQMTVTAYDRTAYLYEELPNKVVPARISPDPASSESYYTIDGKSVPEPTAPGLYLRGNTRILVR